MGQGDPRDPKKGGGNMANINYIQDKVCGPFGGADLETCKANVAESPAVQDCINKNNQNNSALTCVQKKINRTHKTGQTFDPLASRGTPADAVVKKIYDKQPISDPEAALIDEAYVKNTNKAMRDVLAGTDPDKNTKDAKRIQSLTAAYQILLDSDTSEATKKKIDPAQLSAELKERLKKEKSVDVDAADASLPNKDEFFIDLTVGLALTTATYRDNFMDADSIASDNPIGTDALNAGKSPSGNFPGQRYDLTLGYGHMKSDKLRIRTGLYGRYSAIQQGYENPQLGRQVSDLKQISVMPFIGIEYYISPNFSVFGDLMVGLTSNTFSDNSGNLPTSATALEGHASLKQLEGEFLSGQIHGGAAYNINRWVALTASLAVYGDATQAESTLDGGGTINYGTTGVEVTGSVGVRVRLGK